MFRKKTPKRLYYPTKSSWYKKPRKRKRTSTRASRKIFSYNIRTNFTRLIKDAFLYVVVGVIFIGLIIFLLFSSKFAITTIEVSRDNLHIDSAAVGNLLNNHKGTSIFAFSKYDASHLISETYPEFSNVIVRKILPNSIKIELETYEIVANIKAFYVLPKVEKSLLEEEEDKESKELSEAFKVAFDLGGDKAKEEKEEITSIEQKALINSIGQAIFDRQEDLELMTIIVDGLSQPIEDREIIIPVNDMEYILNSIKYLTNLMQMEISGVKYLPVAREVHLTTDNNLTLWLSTERSYKEQIDKLNTIYSIAELDKENLVYIDLRIKEKIIYCPSGKSCAR